MPIARHQARNTRSPMTAIAALTVIWAGSLVAFEADAAVPDNSRSAIVRNGAPDATRLAQVRPPEPAKPVTPGQSRPRPIKKKTSLECGQEAKARGMTNPFSPERRAFIADCIK